MALSCFEDRDVRPGPEALAGALGPAAAQWDRLREEMVRRHPALEGTWAYAAARYGWSFRLALKGRILLTLVPQEGRFLAGVVLGERAARAAAGGGAGPRLRALIEAAPRYAEGRGFRIPVADPEDLADVLEAAALKTAP
jgi:hypothetical protein